MALLMPTGVGAQSALPDTDLAPGSVRYEVGRLGVSAFWTKEDRQNRKSAVEVTPLWPTYRSVAIFDLDDGPLEQVAFVEAPEDTTDW